jgi:hypothetical protein
MAHALQPFLGGAPRAVALDDRDGSMTDSAPTLIASPAQVVDANTVHGIVAAVARSWQSAALGRLPTDRLIARILERPLHTAAFSGAVQAGGALLLVADGVLYGAFDPESGVTGDAIIEALPSDVVATLFAVPPGLDPRIVTLLASLLVPARPRLSGLDTSFADLPQLAGKLAAEGFDGAVRFCSNGSLGFALFGRGRRVLDVFGAGWGEASATVPWERWIGTSGAMASVEDREVRFPALTFRQQLAGVSLDVIRPPEQPDAIRTDTVARGQALELRPRETPAELRRGESTFTALLDGDPAFALARWALVDLAPQFQQYGRTARCRALVEPLDRVGEVRLHHGVPRVGGGTEAFDVVTCEGGRPRHVMARVAHGTAEAVERFVARALAVKEAPDGDGLTGAILVAPRFDEEALEAYLGALRPRDRRSIFRTLDAFTHREGAIRLGARSVLHVLLVEDEGGRRRPLVPG